MSKVWHLLSHPVWQQCPVGSLSTYGVGSSQLWKSMMVRVAELAEPVVSLCCLVQKTLLGILLAIHLPLEHCCMWWAFETASLTLSFVMVRKPSCVMSNYHEVGVI